MRERLTEKWCDRKMPCRKRRVGSGMASFRKTVFSISRIFLSPHFSVSSFRSPSVVLLFMVVAAGPQLLWGQSEETSGAERARYAPAAHARRGRWTGGVFRCQWRAQARGSCAGTDLAIQRRGARTRGRHAVDLGPRRPADRHHGVVQGPRRGLLGHDHEFSVDGAAPPASPLRVDVAVRARDLSFTRLLPLRPRQLRLPRACGK